MESRRTGPLKIPSTKISVILYNLSIYSAMFHKKPLVPGSNSTATNYAKEITRSSFFFHLSFLMTFPRGKATELYSRSSWTAQSEAVPLCPVPQCFG